MVADKAFASMLVVK